MSMHKLTIAFCCLFLIVTSAWAQGDRGTITGTVTDPAGAMVPNAAIEAKNVNTGGVYQAASSTTGNYTLVQLPAGSYQLSVTVPGFKQYQRTSLTVMVAQTLRIDVKLEVGAPTEIVTVSADAPLLKTESGELSHNISTERLDDLPMLSAVGMRDPFAAANLMPGTGGTTGAMRVNGMPGFTMSLRIDGQDATQNIWTNAYGMSTPSVDSVEETTIQTSNYAAEYGQAGGGILNMTMRSGTNKLHGSAFEYMRNEALNANQPYRNPSTEPGYHKARDRNHDWGLNLGGPVYIPGIYDGRDKTFFFYAFEQNYLKNTNNSSYTVPTPALQAGDFTQFLTTTQIGTDPLGRPVYQGEIFMPTVLFHNGVPYRDPFMGCDGNTMNKICMTTPNLIDPVAQKYQGIVGGLSGVGTSLTNNYKVTWPAKNVTTINSVKIDHNLSSKFKLSGYYSNGGIEVGTFSDGLPAALSAGRRFAERTHTIRANLDYSVSPTVFMHFGAGLMHFIFKDPGKDISFDNLTNLSLPGTFGTFPPYIQMDNTRGSLNTGVVAFGQTHEIKPTGDVSLAWVKGNHSYKFGGEVRFESHPVTVFTPANGQFYFSALQTSDPGFAAGASGTGHPYASFLLGMLNNGQIGVPNRFHLGKQSWAFFAQDSWKITPKITLDYGLRWDYQTNLQETHGRMPNFDPTVPNKDYNNLPGSVVYKKNVADVYPHAWGPRVGLAYQFMPRTVFRAGAGISYGQTGALEMWNLRMGSYVDYGPGVNAYDPIGCLRNGPNQDTTPYNCFTGNPADYTAIVPVWPDPNAKVPRTPFSTVQPMIDRQAGRPPRQFQWSIGIQREITGNLSIDVSYVGNRGAWWNVNGAMTDPNHITPAILAAHNFDLSNAADQALITASLSSLTAAQMTAHNLTVPFPGFNSTVNQAIRPFPHIGNIFKIWAKNGRTWYDSLQVKVNKRYSHGLDMSLAYSWQKEETIGVETNDTAFNTQPAINNIDDFWSNKAISGYSIPHRLVIAANYRVPKWNINRYASWILRDWTIGSILTYQTGLPIMAPRGSNNIASVLKLCNSMGVLGGCNGSLFNANSSASYATRVAGQPLFLVDPNSSFDPFSNFMLNKNAWQPAPDWKYGTGAPYYSDYRYRRRPSENMSMGRIFPVREGMQLSVRIELMNVFNRVQIPNPSVDFNSNDATLPQFKDANGKTTFGFGRIDAFNATGQRTGQIVMRFTF